MTIQERKVGDRMIIQIDGELDASSSITMDKALQSALEQGEKKIMVDCQDLEYISSPGLGVFMSYLQEIEEKNASMVLYNLKDNVRSTFKILGLDELLKIVETEEEATAYL